jgi:formamidopyrimidine-DNA glycosylase
MAVCPHNAGAAGGQCRTVDDMPEIAEVEVVRRGLAPLAGATLEHVELRDGRLPDIAQTVAGRQVSGLRRHGKLLAFALGDRALVVHLRMTGSLWLGHRPDARAVLGFADGRTVSFVDPRRFGTLTVGPADGFADGLAVDLLAATPEELDAAAQRAVRSRRAVKALLLDQRALVAGVGNYLADETVGAVGGVHPAQGADTVTLARWRALLDGAQHTARVALELGGVSMRDYVHPDGTRGRMQDHLRFYGRAGQPCVRCAAPLAKAVVAGRGTTFCAACAADIL